MQMVALGKELGDVVRPNGITVTTVVAMSTPQALSMAPLISTQALAPVTSPVRGNDISSQTECKW